MPLRRSQMKIEPTPGHAKPKKLYQQLYIQVLIGVMLGIVVGHFWPEFGAAMKPFGDIFVRLVKMMIPPVVFCTIASGIYSMADNKEIGKTLLKALGLFYALTIIPLLTGLVPVYVRRPVYETGEVDGLRRFHHSYHSEHILCSLHRRPGAAGAFARHSGWIRTHAGWHGRRAGKTSNRFILDRTVRGIQFSDETRSTRCIRRDGIHRRTLRNQIDRLAWHADRHLLCGLRGLRLCHSQLAGADAWLQPDEAPPLHQRRALDRAGHVLDGAGVASPAVQAGKARLQERRGWPR